MVRHPIIRRYLDPERFEMVKRDSPALVKLINESGGEYSFQLRENYFNIYYQGNALAKVVPNKSGTYSVEIHRKFVEGSVRTKLERYSVNSGSSGNHVRFVVRPANLHQFFRRSNMDSLSSKIRGVHYGEEITFEQMLITDNPPSNKFIIIDRQIADHASKAQIDLLALERDLEDAQFHLLVIEVKLGRNEELLEKVGGQLNQYVDHVRKHIRAYADCYEKNYQQKKELGLFGPDFPDSIEIERNAQTAQGLVVVCGYSQLGGKAVKNLKKRIKKSGWSIKVHQMPRLKLP